MKLRKLKTAKTQHNCFEVFTIQDNKLKPKFQYIKDPTMKGKKYLFSFIDENGGHYIVGDKNENFKDLNFMFNYAFGNL